MILNEILAKKKEEIAKAKERLPVEWLGRSLAYNPYVPRDFKGAIDSKEDLPYRVIVELKQASPQAGVICKDFDPLQIAHYCALGGAAAISVPTEEHYFLGCLDYLGVKRFLRIPVLRQDFIIDEYQIVESAVYGADSLLLIAEILPKQTLKSFIDFSRRFGMEPVIEVRSKSDLLKAIACGADILSINHYNLEDYSLDLTRSEALVPLIPKGKTVIAAGGITQNAQLEQLHALGVDSCIVGKQVMQQQDIEAFLKTFITKK